jgi:Mitochondrial carrier protein
LLAGSVAGVIGIGLSYPLDTVNTRFQLVQGEQEADCGKGRSSSKLGASNSGIVDTALQIYQNDGWQGFFAGAKGMMAGESVIKAVAFASNALALANIEASSPSTAGPSALALFVAACFAGMMTAFVVAPVERIKVVMQSSPNGAFKDEWDCARTILRQQGLRGLVHGLDATLARDIPGYGFYFAIYGMLNQQCDFGPLSPILFGAAAGSASWIPVYPIDTVKTLMQRSMSHSSTACVTAWQVTSQLYARGGARAFSHGLAPKLLRSAVNHATTFTVYESAMQLMAHPQ